MSYRNGPGVEQGHRQNHARQALPRGSIVPPPLSRVTIGCDPAQY